MIFRQFQDPETHTYTYLVGDKATRQAILIDPVKGHVQDYLDHLRRLDLNLEYVLDTHTHADHVTGAGDLRERTQASSVMHENAKAECVSIKVKDGDALPFAGSHLAVIHTPGHTPCSVCYRIGDRVFTGDTLLINGCGRTDFQSGSAEELWDSVTRKLFSLEPETLVYPGHDYHKRRVSSIGQEMDLNPRFSVADRDAFVKLMDELKLDPPKKIQEALAANERCGRIS